MQHIVSYTPQQNGVTKRKNHTLKEMDNCMIQSKGLSLHYWTEAINYANYIVNHTLTKALKLITLEEAWSKIKENVSHFHVFGSVAWDHILDEKRKALQPKNVFLVRSVFLLDILNMSKATDLLPSFQ
jgi:hypothetical protein